MRKYVLFLIIVLLIPIHISAHEQLKDGWHIVTSKTDKDDYNFYIHPLISFFATSFY